ncbi:radical SAM family heme chaperone HemW [bacterium]|nr:radical SAM family heme chaperone HemW [bacterium]
MVKSAYIHIPFCKSKCHYCSFISFNKFELKEEYLKSLSKEIDYFYNKEVLDTIYFGGGTPSCLTVSELENILNKLNFNNSTEITIECNPDDCDYEYLKSLFDTGINRISMGCQTFNDEILKQINRRHSSSQVFSAVENARKAGFKNISLDFIYGLPNQNLQMFLKDLEKATELGIQHISLYGLKLEEGCYFYRNLPQNLADDDEQADMYLEAINLLTKLGYEHYEISNFSLSGHNSRHNLTYWDNKEYYGFGVAAHGYTDNIRYGNKDTIESYIKTPTEHKNSKLLTKQEQLEEEIFLGLRKMEGIDISHINSKYNIDFQKKYNNILNKYATLNLLKKTSRGYKFTPNGILVSNVVLADFLD